MSMPCAHNGQDQVIAIKNHSLCIFTVGNHVDLVDLNHVCQFHMYLAHVIEHPNFRIPNPQYFVYLLDQRVGRDILQFIY